MTKKSKPSSATKAASAGKKALAAKAADQAIQAAAAGDLATLQSMAAAGVSIRKHSSTALQLFSAARHNNGELIEALIALGADVNARLFGNEIPLHAAARQLAIQSAKVLIAHGSRVNVMDNHGCTPLYVATAQAGIRPEEATLFARVLLEHGADGGLRDRYGGSAFGSCPAWEALAHEIRSEKQQQEIGASTGPALGEPSITRI